MIGWLDWKCFIIVLRIDGFMWFYLILVFLVMVIKLLFRKILVMLFSVKMCLVRGEVLVVLVEGKFVVLILSMVWSGRNFSVVGFGVDLV